MSEMTREQVVVGLDELRAALLDTAVLAKGGMSELVLQEAIAALSSPYGGRGVLAEGKGVARRFPIQGYRGYYLVAEFYHEGPDHMPVCFIILPAAEPQGEGRDE